MKRALLAIVVAAAFPAAAFAGTCAAPTSLHPQIPNGTISGTTCDQEPPGIFLGGAVTRHPSAIYQFTYNNNAAGPLNVTTGNNIEVVIATSCESAPIAGFASGVPVDVGSIGLTNGTNYLMIVSTDNGIEPTNPPTCGPFTATYVDLPVSLQSFSVE